MREVPTFVNQEEKAFHRFYQWSLLWLKVKPTAKRLAIAALIIFDVVTIGSSVFSFVTYGVADSFSERSMIGAIVDTKNYLHSVTMSVAAKPLKVSDPLVFSLGDDRVDFYVELTNPNADWVASFQYAFTYGETTTPETRGFILPNEEAKPFTNLAIHTTSVPKSAVLVITNLTWTRINRHAIDDFSAWQAERMNVGFSNITFDANLQIDATRVGQTTFTATNLSAYGYWAPSFTVVLLRNGKVVGVNKTTIPEFTAGEARDVVVNWFGTVPQANETRIVPDVDILDPSVYMPFHGEPVPDVRERVSTKRR